MKLYMAPLEGVTTYIYRNYHEAFYGKIDKYFAPFVSPTEKYVMTPKERKDLLPENNAGINLVPQILTSKSNQFIDTITELETMGYKEFNLNLGCPSGTVCAKGKGAGFLPETQELKRFLDDIYDYGQKNNIAISLKTRLGFYDPEEFYDLIEIFNEFPVHELIIHPRIRSDYYKGAPRTQYYSYAINNSKAPLVYNGNIFSITDYKVLCKKLGVDVDKVMVGRGIISNPSLSNELLTGDTTIDYEKFWKFHDALYNEYKSFISPDINILYKMKELWTYWRYLFDGVDKEIKHLLKAKKCAEYEEILLQIKSSANN